MRGTALEALDPRSGETYPKKDNLHAMACNLIAMARNLIAMASNLIAMVSERLPKVAEISKSPPRHRTSRGHTAVPLQGRALQLASRPT